MLPPRILYTDFGSDCNRYKAQLLAVFRRDFMEPPYAEFRGLPIFFDPRPDYYGLPKRLWHCLSEGEDRYTREEDRVVQFDRCERLSWARPLIELAESGSVPNWTMRDGRRTDGYIATDDFAYVVVLKRTERDQCWYLATTYCPNRRRRERLRRDWEASRI